jgi:N6-adenosine-specific RNA methylase IME4
VSKSLKDKWCPEPESNQRHADFQSAQQAGENNNLGSFEIGKCATQNQTLTSKMENAFEGLEPPYSVIYADPPWSFKTRSSKGNGKSPSQHYEVVSLEDICALPVANLAAKDCHLFMWTTAPHLLESMKVIEAWGFNYSTVGFVWVKTTKRSPASIFTNKSLHWGMGYTTRQNAEFCLYARRGKPKTLVRDVHSVIISKLREHSRKPDEARARIERLCAGPYVELFARTAPDNWDVWGNEIDKFGEAA